jgi:hypothetical protein
MPSPAAFVPAPTPPATAMHKVLPEGLADALENFVDEEIAAPMDVSARETSRLVLLPPARPRNSRAWLWHSLKDSGRNYGETGRRLRAWWIDWRKSAPFKTLVAFAIVYALLAMLRHPAAETMQNRRHVADMAVIETFLKSYATSGGALLTEKPHGGAELYPRGVVLQDELLDAFRHAATGSTFTVRTMGREWNPLAGFYTFSPIFAGGNYFQLERKFDLTPFRFTFLIRKDSEEAGALLMTRVELMP